MSEPMKPDEIKKPDGIEKNDSFGFDNKKSPWFLFAMIQIPILIIMVIIIYFIYQQRQM